MNYARYGSVYIATNLITGEQYIGQTIKRCSIRYAAHKVSAINPKFKFGKAIKLHGYENFTFFEVYAAFDKLALDRAEIRLIAELSPEYNMTKGGAGQPMKVISEQVKKQRSDAAKARWANPEWAAKTIASLKKAGQSERAKEQGKALAATGIGPKLRWAGYTKIQKPPTNVGARAEGTRRSWEDEDIRASRVAGLRRVMSTPEYRAKMAEISRGRVMPIEGVEKSSRGRYKHIYCEELGVTFISGRHAAKHFSVVPSAISNVVKSKGKLYGKYSLAKVA